MTTSGTIDSSMVAGNIILAALQEMGVLAAGETPKLADYTIGLRTLNWMLKSFQARGANLWRETNGQVEFAAGVAAGTLGPEVEDLSSVRVQVGCSHERPLFRYERGDYMALPNKCTPGTPTIYYLDKQLGASNLYVWPVPTASTMILIDYVRILEDVTDISQTLDIPQRWMETVYVALAARLCGAYGVNRLDPTTAGALAQRAAGMERLMLDRDRPASYFMSAA